jgi:hypothetical protein
MPSQKVLPRSAISTWPVMPSKGPMHRASAAAPTSSGVMNQPSSTKLRRKP